MPALRACLALACVALGVTTLPDGVSAGTQPTTWIAVTSDATAARDPDALHGPVAPRHDTEDADPHKLLPEPPAAPTGLRAGRGRVDGEVRLSWNAPAPTDDIEHHDYRYHTGGRYGRWITIPDSGSSSNHVGYVNGLTGGVAHTFQVRAINTNGAPSLPSAAATVTLPGAVTPRGTAGGAAARGAVTPRGTAGGDPPVVVVTLELSPSSIDEAGGVSTVTASLDSTSATALTVTISAEGVDPALPEDFTLSANQALEIAARELTSTGTVTISANDNTVEELDKEVTVSGTVAGATDVTGPSDVTLTITDDDEPTATICADGRAGVNLCSNIDLMSYLPINDIGGGIGSDIWGWTDSSTGKGYAIMGRSTGTAFVDISDPLRPIYLGDLPPHSGDSQWRDMKVYLDHAFIVTEASRSGMQVFDLTRLRTVSSPPVTFSESAHYSGFSDAHNIAINEDSGFAYAVGTDTCEGGLHMINIQNPTNPTSAGCFSGDGYTHDAQCVNYIGPDPDHQGAEICFNSNTDTLTVVDVTNKAAPEMLSRTGYTGSGYTHQGWLTEDHAYFVLGDEYDESRDPTVTGTTTYLWDVSDLDSPALVGTHVSTTTRAIDHNQYIKGKYTYQSNYQAGLRILDVTDIANGNLTEVAFFDMVPDADSPLLYEGTWGNYPFFDSGIVVVSERTQGLFVLRPNLVDRIEPKVAHATVDRETLTLTYGEALDATSKPAIDAFAVAVEGAERAVSGVSVSGSAVELTLASAVTVAEEVTVAYTVPQTSPIRDEAQNNAPGFSSRVVRNDTLGPPGTPDAPTVTAASATSLTVTWAEPPNAKPPITDYDVQYRIGDSGGFTDWPHAGAALTSTITGLTESTVYEVQVLARNPEGTSSWSLSGSGTPAPPPNTAPMASATATTPTTVNGLGRVTLDGTATDPEGDTLTYEWTSDGGGTFDDASALDTTWTASAKTDAAQDIVLTLTVTDDGTGRLTHAAEVNVRVRENQRPTASVSPDTDTVDGGGAVTLDGTASDPDTTTLTYAWTSSGGGSFDDDAALDTTWTAPPKTNAPQDITLTLKVADDGHVERAATVTVQVTVRANRAPDVTATATTPTTVNGGGTVTLHGTASDPDGDPLLHTWSSNGGGIFEDASALDPTWTAPPKTNALQNIVLTLTVTEDRAGARTETANVDVTVRANQAPTASATAMPTTVDGGGTVGLVGTAMDRDDGTLTYRWRSDGGGIFDDDEALVTPWIAPRAATADETVVLTLTVTDRTNASASATASVTVRANQAPRVTVSPTTVTVDGEEALAVSGAATDPEGDRLTYRWSSNGGGTFDDDAAPETTWTAPPKTNAAQEITLTLTVTDDGHVERAATVTVQVTVRANRAPDVTATATTPTTVNGGGTVTLHGTASDPDGDPLLHTWSSNGGGIFEDASALDTTWTAPPKTNALQNIVLTLTVTEDRAGARTETANVDVTVRANQAPTASATAMPTTVDGGGTVGLVGTAMDRDDGTLTYRWRSDGGGIFDDDEALVTPWIAPRATAANERVVLTLTVTDRTNASASATASVTVRANQAPRVTVSPTTVTVDGEEALAVSGAATDPEGDRLTYRWSSNGGGTFDDDAAPETTWTAPPKTNAAQDITLTLKVADDGHVERAATVTVQVTVRANRAPDVTATATTPTTVNGGGMVTLRGTASDPDGDPLLHTWSSNGGGSFDNASALDPTWTAPPKTNALQNIVLTLTVTEDRAGARTETANVDVTVRANQAPTASATAMPTTVDGGGTVRLVGTAMDRDDGTLTYRWRSDGGGIFDDDEALVTPWIAPRATAANERVVLTLTVTDRTNASASATASVTVRANQAPRVTVSPTTVTVDGEEALAVSGAATDPEGDRLTYRWSSNGGGTFDDDAAPETTWTAPPKTNAAQDITLTLTVTDDGYVERAATVTVQVTVRGDQPPPPIIFTGGGGGPSGPTPSDEDFEWTVSRDIEELDGGNDWPTGLWSDGAVLWLAENGQGADDEVYAYDLESGERIEEREFALAETNRAPRGFWSGDETAWVSDSGQDRLFAYELARGERVEERELELPRDNRDARGIWSDGTTMWVLDGGKNSLFAYDLESGELLAEYTLDSANDAPHGIWSDGVTVWVSNHDPKRLFAYRLPAPERPAAEDAEPQDLMRVRDEEFTELSRASNNSPRGLWSDGEVMYVADESDDRVYSYNMPDAIDTRLASLTLSGVEIGEFAPARPDYEGVAADGVTETTLEAEAAQRRATVVIEPADADEVAEGRQVALDGLDEIRVTVTSADGSRTKVYRVAIGEAGAPETAHVCLGGVVNVGFSLVVSGGGSVEDLESCAESRDVTAFYVPHEGEYVPYILGAPEFVNLPFRELFPGGLPALTPLIAKSDGPPSPTPASDDVPQFGPDCLRGAIATGFSLVLYEGGSVEDLDTCAQGRDVTAAYALAEGEYVHYILGAPDFVNEAFVALFPEGLAPVTPLIARSD